MSQRRFCIFLLLSASAAFARSSVVVDASKPLPPVRPLPFAVGGTSKDGHTLGANARYLTRDGRPWLPVMGEFHYARYPAAEWERELLKMKAGGIDVVSTYVFWIFHEPAPGRFDWSGRRDLRRFVELCRRHGLYVWLRIGPWDHGELRNGGFPDWLVEQQKNHLRDNDPGYLGEVGKFFDQIGNQVRGQFWRDGGPIIGVQIENEYHPEKDGVAHMQTLLGLARRAGLDAPFYTATGWDHAVVPPQTFLPVFSGYTDQFWSGSLEPLPPNPNFFFTTIRAEDNVSYLLQPKDEAYHLKYAGYPYLTAELGGGMATAYHRRPVMHAADSTAAALVRLGSGATLIGYYMYHGGTNPDAAGPVEESFSGWNAFNDLETKSYDFQAPIGEFGQISETFRTTKLLHLFIHDFGEQLAPMPAYFPEEAPRSLDDSTTPRVAARTDGTEAFVFINNYERNYRLSPKRHFQITLKLPGGPITLPRTPVTLPDGLYTEWPVNLPVGAATLRSATAELLCRLANPSVVVFGANVDVPAEFVFTPGPGASVTATGSVKHVGADVVVTGLVPGRNAVITVRAADGATTSILLLPRADALNLWKERVADRERLVLSPATLWSSGRGLELETTHPEKLEVSVYPRLDGDVPGFRTSGTTGVFTNYIAEVNAAPVELATVRQERRAAPPPPVRINPDPARPVAMAPTEADFERAAVWSIGLPDDRVAGSADALLEFNYVGDVARLYAGKRLLTDNYYRGTPFKFGLWRLTPEERRAGLTLEVLPLRRDAPVYLPPGAWPDFHGAESAVSLGQMRVVQVYHASFAVR